MIAEKRSLPIAVLKVTIPFAAGLLWVAALYEVLQQLHAAIPYRVGLHTLEVLLYNPVMFVWEVGNLPTGDSIRWGLAALYAYYGLLTLIVWKAPGSRQSFRIAAVAYGAHFLASLIAFQFYIVLLWPGIPGLGRYYLGNDLKALWSLADREPAWVALFGLGLTGWHAVAWWRMRQGWMRHVGRGSYRVGCELQPRQGR